jgi:hypothetical protein
MQLRELAANRVRLGYRRLTVLLKREGCFIALRAHYASGLWAKGTKEVGPGTKMSV